MCYVQKCYCNRIPKCWTFDKSSSHSIQYVHVHIHCTCTCTSTCIVYMCEHNPNIINSFIYMYLTVWKPHIFFHPCLPLVPGSHLLVPAVPLQIKGRFPCSWLSWCLPADTYIVHIHVYNVSHCCIAMMGSCISLPKSLMCDFHLGLSLYGDVCLCWRNNEYC